MGARLDGLAGAVTTLLNGLIVCATLAVCTHLHQSALRLGNIVDDLHSQDRNVFLTGFCAQGERHCEVSVRHRGKIKPLCKVGDVLPAAPRYWRIRCGPFVIAQIYH